MEDKCSGFAPSVGAEKLLVVVQAVDALLDELECGEEYGIDDAGTAHGNSETLIHAGVEELNLLLLSAILVLSEAVALVDALRRVDGINTSPTDETAEAASYNDGHWRSGRVSASIGEQLL